MKKQSSNLNKIKCLILASLMILNTVQLPALPVQAAGENSEAIITPEYLTYSNLGGLYLSSNSNAYEEKNFIDTVISDLGEDVVLPSAYSSVEEGYITSVKDQEDTNYCWSFASNAVAEANMIKKYGASSDIDFAEKHLAHFVKRENKADPYNTLYGDRSEMPQGDNWTSRGRAYPFEYISQLMSWSGPVNEEMVPWDGGAPSEEMRYQSEAHLQEARYFSLKDRDAIKQFIMENGAVLLSYQHDTHKPTYFKLPDNTYDYYLPPATRVGTSHMVTIVGWDDSFLGKGAWLIKNSYGTTYGRKGYFWIPYDYSRIENIIGLRFEDKNNYDYNNQYDGSIMGASYTGAAANIFRATQDEEICAVGTFILLNRNREDDSTYNYTIKVYKNLPDNTNPTAGELVETVTGRFPDAGYYTIPLNHKVAVKEGEYYSVVLETECYIGHDNHCYAPGTSFELLNGEWEDCIVRDYNCSIKAFNNISISAPKNLKVEYGKTSFTLSWDEVDDAVGYGIYYLQADGTEVKVIETKENSHIFSDVSLFPEPSHNIYVRAYYDKNIGPASKTIKVNTYPVHLSTVILLEKGNGFYLEWDEVEDASAYRVYMDGEPVLWTDKKHCTIDGLNAGQTYSFNISAITDSVESFLSNTVTQKAEGCLIPPNLKASMDGVNCILTWDGVTQEDATYRVDIYRENGEVYDSIDVSISAGEVNTYTVYGIYSPLKATVSYLRNEEEEAYRNQPCSHSEQIYLTDNTLQNFQVIADDGKISLSWDSLEGATGYQVLISNWTDGNEITNEVITETEYSVEGLINNKTYYYEVAPVIDSKVSYARGIARYIFVYSPEDLALPEVTEPCYYGMLLSEIELSDTNWRWGYEAMLEIGDMWGYKVEYIPDPDIWFGMRLDVLPAIPKLEHEDYLEIPYGKALGDIPLDVTARSMEDGEEVEVPGTLQWAEPDRLLTPDESGEYEVVFIPENTMNYECVESKIWVNVTAKPNDIHMPGEEMILPYRYKNLADVPLGPNWKWQDGTDVQTELTPGTPVTATAVYTGDDAEFYTNNAVEVTVTRSACIHEGAVLQNRSTATCTEDGYTGDVICAVCGNIEEGDVISAYHSWGTGYEKNDEGHWTTCTECFTDSETEAHKYASNRDIACYACGYERELPEITPPPEDEPTNAPTEAPTSEPTNAPTEAPTSEPTNAPTEAPTSEPTNAPTEAPTSAPTEEPTEEPETSKNHITGIEVGEVSFAGDTMEFTAIGFNMDITPTDHARRYVPASWSVNPSGTWDSAPYVASFTIEKPGIYTLKVTFKEQEYLGGKWNDTGKTEVTSVEFNVKEKPVEPTAAPTATPTATPTAEPVETTSPTPTQAPANPTDAPTSAPEEAPVVTAAPAVTEAPTVTETPAPTATPDITTVSVDTGDNSPQTGENAMIWVWYSVILLVSGSLGGVLFFKRRRR